MKAGFSHQPWGQFLVKNTYLPQLTGWTWERIIEVLRVQKGFLWAVFNGLYMGTSQRGDRVTKGSSAKDLCLPFITGRWWGALRRAEAELAEEPRRLLIN